MEEALNILYLKCVLLPEGASCLPSTDGDTIDLSTILSRSSLTLKSPMLDLELLKNGSEYDYPTESFNMRFNTIISNNTTDVDSNSTEPEPTSSWMTTPEVNDTTEMTSSTEVNSRRRREVTTRKPCVREKMYISFAGMLFKMLVPCTLFIR